MTIDELKFQSPPPMREATTIPLKMMPASLHFNPRLPCGRRRYGTGADDVLELFQSSPPMREATRVGESRCEVLVISIPASHARSDGVRARCGTG